MAVVLQMYFDKEGPFGKDYFPLGKSRAESINKEDGFIWKIWTENAESKKAGGIYLFDTREQAQTYIKMHTERLEKIGASNFVSEIFEINEGLTEINKGPLKPLE